MGYAHYFAYAPQDLRLHAIWQRLRQDAGAIVRFVEEVRLIELAGGDGCGRPQTSGDTIALNGPLAHGEDYDELSISLAPPAEGPSVRWSYGFCRTGPLCPLPYDEAATAVLLRAHQLAPRHFAIDSDGDWRRDWAGARTICAVLFDAWDTACPFTADLRRNGPRCCRT